MQITRLLEILGYSGSSNYYDANNVLSDARTSHLFRAALAAGAVGVYVFRTSPDGVLPYRPVVYIAEASTPERAREIHRALWNIGQAPFLVVLLPDHIRVYTGFDYERSSEVSGLLLPFISTNQNEGEIKRQLSDYKSESIDLGKIWEAKRLDTSRRVDKRLLSSLNSLSRLLIIDEELTPNVAHALIGKFVYFRYLRDRKIISDKWLAEHSLTAEGIFGTTANLYSLRQLSEVLDNLFNGEVFPIDFEISLLNDDHIYLVAAVFRGDIPLNLVTRQLSLDFDIFDFRYLPIELLSSIYEQFLRGESEVRDIGAYYTPEYLAEYVIAELEAVVPVRRKMKVLDPSCGSGVFLVLTYRRLIETEIAKRGRKIRPSVLRAILLESVYGVEREKEACYVTEFSLLLTLLDYIEPPELHRNKQFKFPNLHNLRIFEADFFDTSYLRAALPIDFDWIVGNPPWIEVSMTKNDTSESFVKVWISENIRTHPVGRGRVSEAFSWRALDHLSSKGVVGLVLHSKTLVNYSSQSYRKAFFTQNRVWRIINLSNMSGFLFGDRASEPAAIVVYSKSKRVASDHFITHYGPFFVNQTSALEKGLWTITVNESEISVIPGYEAMTGKGEVWKLALWGTSRDRDAINRLVQLFPRTLHQLCQANGWIGPNEGSQLRNAQNNDPEKIKHISWLQGEGYFDNKIMNNSSNLFFVSPQVIKTIPKEMCYVRIKGGENGLSTTTAPHLFLHASWKYVVFSDRNFVIPPRQIGISAPSEDAQALKALSMYLSSSFARYFLFFRTPEWGIERNRITLDDVRFLPAPQFNKAQIMALVALHDRFVEIERSGQVIENSSLLELDTTISSIFGIPKDILILAREFSTIRIKTNRGEARRNVIRPPTNNEMLEYGSILSAELDSFVGAIGASHKITLYQSRYVSGCTIELLDESVDVSEKMVIKELSEGDILNLFRLQDILTDQVSQRFYVRKGLRLFDGPSVHILKRSRLIDWTQTQALNDADDIISEVLSVVPQG